jgi:hypothetical protein
MCKVLPPQNALQCIPTYLPQATIRPYLYTLTLPLLQPTHVKLQLPLQALHHCYRRCGNAQKDGRVL